MIRRDRLVCWLTVTAAACAGAVLAHVAIDAAGDFLLTHDPYDDVSHASRGHVAALALVLLTTLLVRLAWHALLEARGGAKALRTSLARIIERPLAFVVAVNGVALPVLAAMSALDSLVGAGHVAPLVDLVGGSVWLSAAIAIPVASAAAVFALCVLRLLFRSCDALVDALGAIIALLAAPDRADVAISLDPEFPSVSRLAACVGGNAGKRAPPLFA